MSSKITYVDHFNVISYLIKAIEDFFIKKAPFVRYLFLIIDLPLITAFLILHFEQKLHFNVINYLFAHFQYDAEVVVGPARKMLGGEYKEEKTEKEKTLGGRVFQFTRHSIKKIWGIIIFAIMLPVWPLISLYNFFSGSIILGVLYYFLMFYNFHSPLRLFLYYYLFGIVTFIVSSITIPWILSLLIYFKYLFSLKKKSWKEIDNEAQAAFLGFYRRIQNNKMKSLEEEQLEGREKQVEGGVYYLFLKILHKVKDKILHFNFNIFTETFKKITAKSQKLCLDYEAGRSNFEETGAILTIAEIKKTILALVLTFLLSAALAYRGSGGHGLIGPILISFLDQSEASVIWFNTMDDIGYYENWVSQISFFPHFMVYIAMFADLFLGYFFKFYYFIVPLYLSFFVIYYQWILDFLINKLFFKIF